MAQLAIKGHPTRGKEVIQLLEMLGGINKYNLRGDIDEWFVLNGTKIQRSDRIFAEKGFTLEEFEKLYPYKVGDKVTNEYELPMMIFDIYWDSDFNTIKYNGRFLENDKIVRTGLIVEELQPYEEENIEGVYAYNEINCYHQDFGNKVRIRLGNDFEIKVENNITYIVKKQPQYPKDYEECCNVLMGKTDFQDFSLVLTKLSTNINEENSISPEPPYISLINKFYKLLICRDAYWKIAGEQLGLDKPWKPDWTDLTQKYCILCRKGKVDTLEAIYANKILAFPTAEMRDTFYENFKDLIEQCKELL